MSIKQPGRGGVMDFDKTDMEMIRRGDMLGPTLGAKVATALETLQRERDEAREALRPFAADKLPTTKKTVRDFDEHGLRRMMSPMEIARMRARAALSPKEAEE